VITNSELVVDIYGYWPSFHDAEVLSICFSRGVSTEDRAASVKIELNYWETKAINQGKSDFDYVLDSNYIISLELNELVSSFVSDFNFQNVIDELIIRKIDNVFSLDAVTIHGVDFKFKCKKLSVVNVRPFA
jgi:hypothetical protein